MTLVKWIYLRQLTPLSELIGGVESGAAPMSAPAARAKALVPPAPVKPQASSPKPQAAPSTRPESGPRSGQASLKPQAAGPKPQASSPKPQANDEVDLKSSLLSSIREANKVFYGMVIAQAQKVEVEGDSVVFTFAPVHKTLRSQLEGKRTWIEQLAHAATGRKIAVVAREGQPAPSAGGSDSRQADLRARAKAEPTVQAVLDVFGGDIEDVEEIN
jgi:hypothetical protein